MTSTDETLTEDAVAVGVARVELLAQLRMVGIEPTPEQIEASAVWLARRLDSHGNSDLAELECEKAKAAYFAMWQFFLTLQSPTPFSDAVQREAMRLRALIPAERAPLTDADRIAGENPTWEAHFQVGLNPCPACGDDNCPVGEDEACCSECHRRSPCPDPACTLTASHIAEDLAHVGADGERWS